jgi:hypothetical protein
MSTCLPTCLSTSPWQEPAIRHTVSTSLSGIYDSYIPTREEGGKRQIGKGDVRV